MEKKKCACCVRKVSLGNFAKDRQTKDGLQSWCKKCHSDYYKGLVKLCPCCGKMMPLNAFNKKASNEDGLATLCRRCTKKVGWGYHKEKPQVASNQESEEKVIERSEQLVINFDEQNYTGSAERRENGERTTFIISPSLMRKVKAIAVREHLTMTDIIDFAIKEIVERYEKLHGEVVANIEKKSVKEIFGR